MNCVGDRPLDVDAAHAHADLALVDEGAVRRGLDRVVEVGAGQDDQRVLPAELQHDPLEVAAGRLGEPAAGGRGAGEVDAGAPRGLAISSSPIVAGLARRVRHDVEDAGRQAGLLEAARPTPRRRCTATPRTA